MIYDIHLHDGEMVIVYDYEATPVKIEISTPNIQVDASLLEKEVRQLINALICTTPQARQFIHEGRYGREWKSKTMGLKKEELVDELQKAKVENLWLIDQIRMRSQWDWEDGGLEGGGPG